MKKIIYTLLIGLSLGLIFSSKPFILLIFSSILIFSIVSQGLNILSGYTGQISIGHGAFMAIGAYTSTFLSINFNTPFILNLLIVIILSSILGIIIGMPALRLKGFYLAIATMAFGISIQELISSFSFLGGHIGIRNIPKIFNNDFGMFILNLIFYTLCIYVSDLIVNSTIGIKYKMVRDSEVAAKAYGISISKIKVHAFVVSSIYGGIAGSLYAHTIGYISPTDFGLNTSLNLLAIIVIGGMASSYGSLIGSIIIIGLPFLFSRTMIPMSFIFGILLIIFVLFIPNGIFYGILKGYYNFFELPFIYFIKKYHKKYKKVNKFVEINNKKIHYYENGEGIPIVMIHGNFASLNWFNQVNTIENFKIYSLDLPNFGLSDRINEFSIDTYSNYVKEFIITLKIKNPIIVGHSLGGAIAMNLILKNPNLSQNLILINSSSIDGLKTPEENYPILNLYKNNFSLFKKALKSIMPEMQNKKLLNELVKDGLLMKSECFIENARALEKYNYLKLKNKFNGKMLYLYGKKDTIVSTTMAKKTTDFFNGKLKIIDHVGHSLILEDPNLFITILKDFYKE
ncbi:hypothetical protein OSSY52_16780 [Tepiditoga spiralis]|uniref:AB hydrolase-1 domain-containing protein n=1 Tax=Tepiditoga spiralis TaxID=2108365 RepID=A0A7G1G9B9_9BACT|nr:alpha/beta fold hydrolase [Tepiditoga spiralis]BBE31537.1 hypothetical protein OSSY52_16780 [Tepiditoga spiralis]